jgi:sugar phosphate isomerase/epimerase
MTYGVSTSILSQVPLEQVLRRLAAAGIEQIEISAEPPHFAPGIAATETVRGWLDQLNLSAPVGHALYNTPNLAALDESVRAQSVKDVAASLDMMIAIGTRMAVVHPTGFSPDYRDDNRSDFVGQARKSMHELSAIAGDIGMRLAWENLPHHGAPRPFHDMAELRATIADMPGHVGLCLDTTHALIAGHEPLAQLKIAEDRLFCVHLHDSDGTDDCHWVPGRGVIDWVPFIGRLDEVAFAGPRTVEAIAPAGTEGRAIADVARLTHERFSASSLMGGSA